MSAETLTEWLLRQVADDEEMARAATDGPWAWHLASNLYEDSAGWVGAPGAETPDGMFVAAVSNTLDGLDDGPHIARHDPARVLAECKAKREIVEDFVLADSDYRITRLESGEVRRIAALLAVVRLAAIYADRPGYLEEWRP